MKNTQSDRQTIDKITRGKPSKTSLKHWEQAIFHPKTMRDSVEYISPNWMAAFSHQAKRQYLSLDTDNQKAAAARALNIYKFLQGNGWKKTEQLFAHLKANGWDNWSIGTEFTPEPDQPEAPKKVSTIGEYLDKARTVCGCDVKTFQQYAQCLRHVATEIAQIGDRFELGYDNWLEKVNNVRLSALTDDKIHEWKRKFLNRAKAKGEVEAAHAMTSVNTKIRQCKALFSNRRINDKPSVLDRMKKVADFPDFIPFAEIGFEKRQSMKYHRTFDDRDALIQAAHDELSVTQPEQYKIFWLALGLGLRRNEIDKLEWPSFRWHDGEFGVLRIEKTEFFKPKTTESAADMPLDEAFAAMFRQYQTKATGRFVIESDGIPRKGAVHYHFRAIKLFDLLNTWLKAHGVTGNKPLHSLRKEFGSIMNEQHGIYAASLALRHTDIGITAQHYVKDQIKVLPGIGAMLKKPNNVIPMHTTKRHLVQQWARIGI